jgi:hypothetical protein
LHGVHDIHLNQGNTGAHAGDNGALQDGGLVLALPDRHVGLFLAFDSQRVPTDVAGRPSPDSRPIAELIGGATPPTPSPAPAPSPAPSPTSGTSIYLERALLNPTGDDVGREVVVIGNLADAAVSLEGWQLVDKNHRSTTLGPVAVAPGASALVVLDGSGAQLSNKGGNLVLLDPDGGQVDAVVFTADDSACENRFIRFRR